MEEIFVFFCVRGLSSARLDSGFAAAVLWRRGFSVHSGAS